MENRRRKRYMSAAYRNSFSKLMLNFYLYYEGLTDRAETSEEERAFTEEFGRILKGFLGGQEDLESLEALRNRIVEKTEILTAFSDCFQIYEYVLNRVERRFLVMKDSGRTPAGLAAELVQHIAGLEDDAGRNEMLREIIAQLPVRFTRQKFYSLVMERFSVLTGVSKASIEDFLYMLKTSAMVQLPEHMEAEEELYRILSELRNMDYRGLSREEFESCTRSLAHASRLLLDQTDEHVLMAEMINDLYVLFLTRQEALVEAGEDQDFKTCLSRILDAVDKEEDSLVGEEGRRLLERIEGIQEAVEEIIQAGTDRDDPVLNKIDRLLSGSSFMSLEETEDSGGEADREFVEKKAEEFCEQLDKMFGSMPKAVIRAVMAKVLSGLPMIFRDSQEVEDYIRSSLESCTDHGEREACMELLEQELMG